jgi:hypothetical protein
MWLDNFQTLRHPIHNVLKLICDYYLSHRANKTIVWSSQTLCLNGWKPPIEGIVNPNIDDACKDYEYGGVIRRSEGQCQCLGGFGKSLSTCSAYQVELW